MPRIEYLDLELKISSKKDNTYKVDLLNQPGGESANDFTLPFSELELQDLLLKIKTKPQDIEIIKYFGGLLFQSLFTNEIQNVLSRSLEVADRHHKGLRINLNLTDTPCELLSLPWEYLYNQSLNHFYSLSIKTPIVRHFTLPKLISPFVVLPPLRVLVIISSPIDIPILDVSKEWKMLKESLLNLEKRGLLSVELLKSSTRHALQKKLQVEEYNILHFVGHASFDQESLDDMLIFEDENRKRDSVKAEHIATLLQEHRSLRLVVLNTCEGASPYSNKAFLEISRTLVQHGIPAVVAMQFEIADIAALNFTNEFYTCIISGDPIDMAITEARIALFARGMDVEWAAPALYMHSPSEKVFDLQFQTTLKMTIDSDKKRFSKKQQNALKKVLADFLKTLPQKIRIKSIEKGSVKVTIELSADSAERLLEEFGANPELFKALSSFNVVDIRQDQATYKPPNKIIKILFLAANPLDTSRLRLDEEIRAIDQALRQTDFRDKFDIRPHWAVRVVDLQGYLLRYKPDIVHFSGHGSTSSEIVIEDIYGKSQPIPKRALSHLFHLLKDNIRCVLLNACYSENQAESIAENIDCVIGMSKAISDTAAIGFATAFYQALGFGKDVKTAFGLGCVQIDLEKLNEQEIPKLLSNKKNPEEIFFV